MARSSNKCPNCGEPVSQFAAGCAICGTDLERHRREMAERRQSMPHVAVASRVSGRLPNWRLFDRLRGDVHVTRLVFAILLTLFAPFLGFFFAAFFAYHADQEGRDGIRNALIGVCAGAILMLYVAPFSIWAVLLGA